jgi:hypothetical protein
VALEKPLDQPWRRSRRHDHFHAPGVKDTHHHTARALALAHAPARVLLGPQRQLGSHPVDTHISLAARQIARCDIIPAAEGAHRADGARCDRLGWGGVEQPVSQ